MLNKLGLIVEHTDKPAHDFFAEGCIKLSEDNRNPEGQLPKNSDARFRKVEGVAAKGNMVNRNARYYSTEILRNAVEKIQAEVQGNKFLGEVEHPWEVRSALERAAVKFTNIWMDGDLCKFEGIIMHTARGKELEAILEAGVAVGVSTRGYGSAKIKDIGGQEVEEIQDDYRLRGIDFVLDQANPYGAVNKFESHEGGREMKTLDELKTEFLYHLS